ncbi:hypothetical protein LSTR_LSTR015023 [Laodelphax striatellus]|uniref:PH domain-containing protein n=1 Tax=Laodelphax striatellus TaxID=195883 RepID=A0A482WQ89_LAOST|nr:hypothetical protein LSTR_LSTR015023 [Laodelphax striatellus]
MRTYYFAADSHQQMAQWMNALSLASILQDSSNCWDEHRSNRNNNNTSATACDDSDSGFQRLQPHQNYTDAANPPAANSNSWQNCQLPPGYQPLYANAPPKPRRLNDGSSTERSPERLTDDVGGRTSRMGAQPQQEYNRNFNGSINVQQYNAQHSHHKTVNNLYVINNNINSHCNPSAQLNNSERRTPDTYGRSNNATPCAQQALIRVNRPKQRNPDYEDVYQNNPDLVLNTNHHSIANTVPYVNQQVQYRRKAGYQTVVPETVEDRQRRFAVRPHSADFLEYDAARYYSPTPQSSVDSSNVYDGRPIPQTQVRSVAQKPRPKSSMEIAHPSDVYNGGFDSQAWSEESYARKMRQSASFVAPQLPHASSRATTPSLKQATATFPHDASTVPHAACLMSPQGSAAAMRTQCEVIERQERKWNEYVESRGTVPFVRSASARLARQWPEDDFADVSTQNEAVEGGRGGGGGQAMAFKRRNSTEPRESGNKLQQVRYFESKLIN